MRPEDNLPKNMARALNTIDIAIKENLDTLDFTGLGLNETQTREILVKIEKELPNLKNLNLSKNRLSALPVEIGNLQKLKELDLNSNNLSALPVELGNLQNLEELDLSSNDLSALPVEICNLQNIKDLCLFFNHLSTLPVEIGNLQNLEELDLSNNNLSALPVELGNLQNLEELDLSNNDLSALPVEIGDLQKLEELNLRYNDLSAIPEGIAQLQKLERIQLRYNPLSQETMNFLNATFVNNEVSYNMAAHDVESDYEEVLAKIYGDEMPAILSEIKALDPSWTFLNSPGDKAKQELDEIGSAKKQVLPGEEKRLEHLEKVKKEGTLIAPNVIIGFLKKIPLKEPKAQELYFEIGKYLIDSVVGKTVSDDEKQSALYKIALTLGDCETPVIDALIRGYIDKHRNSNPRPKDYDSLVAREAIESEIISQLRGKIVDGKVILSKNEEIEQVQGLTNAIFMEGAAMNKDNKCKIAFLEDDEAMVTLLFSKTAYPDFAFRQVSDDLAVEFAKLCCKTDQSGKLIKNKEGNYLFSPKKVRGIVEKYKKEALSMKIQREVAISNYLEKIQEILNNTNLTSHHNNPEVVPFLDFKTQKKELREKLLEVPDSEVENVAAEYLELQRLKIQGVAKDIENEKEENSASITKDFSSLAISSPSGEEKREKGKMKELKIQRRKDFKVHECLFFHFSKNKIRAYLKTLLAANQYFSNLASFQIKSVS